MSMIDLEKLNTEYHRLKGEINQIWWRINSLINEIEFIKKDLKKLGKN